MPSMRLVRKLGHRTAEQMRSCLTTASTVRWSVHAKRTTDRVAQPSNCEALYGRVKHLEHVQAFHLP